MAQIHDLDQATLPEVCLPTYLDLFERLTDAVSVITGTTIAYANSAYVRLLELSDRDQLVGREMSDIVAAPDRDVVMMRGQGRQKGEDHPDYYEFGLIGRNRVHHVQVRSIPVLFAGKVAVLTIARDITERKEMEEQLKVALSLLSATLESTADAISTVDFEGNVLNYNQRFLEMWGLDETFPLARARNQSEFMNMLAAKLTNADDYVEGARKVYARPNDTTYDTLLFKDGRVIERYSYPHKVGGETVGVVWNFRDVTARAQLEDLLHHNATHDPLTDLLNRRGFEEELTRRLAQANATGEFGALLLLDLDQFKDINDSLGHPAGDDVLAGLAVMLKRALPASATIARLGGDEFAAILPHVTIGHAEAQSQRLLAELNHHVFDTSAGERVRITASVGLVVYPAHGASVEQLMSRVDLALYGAKEKGRNRFSLYSPIERRAKKSETRLWLRRAIRDALDHDRLELFSQPVIDLRGGAVAQEELLLRLPLENGRLIRAGQFIGVAERSGLILAIDKWVANRALSLLKETEEMGHTYALAINISGAAFEDAELLHHIQQGIVATKADPSRLVFEVTETAAVSNVSGAQRFIRSLKGLGCRFAIDDFGVGFSSMFQLKHLPVDYLKIDGSFIRHIHANSVDQEVVRAMVAIAGALGMSTIAEAVPSAEDAELLRDFGVQYGQGFFLGRPRPVERLFSPSRRSVA